MLRSSNEASTFPRYRGRSHRIAAHSTKGEAERTEKWISYGAEIEITKNKHGFSAFAPKKDDI